LSFEKKLTTGWVSTGSHIRTIVVSKIFIRMHEELIKMHVESQNKFASLN